MQITDRLRTSRVAAVVGITLEKVSLSTDCPETHLVACCGYHARMKIAPHRLIAGPRSLSSKGSLVWWRVSRALVTPLFTAVFVLSCSQQSPEARTAPSVTFRTLSGETTPLEELGKPLLVNFWSTTCSVCIEELPHIAEIQTEFASQGFNLMTVAMPYDPPNAVVNMVREKKWTFPVAIDIEGTVLKGFEPVTGTPTSFLINSEGKIVQRYIGKTDLVKLRSAIKNLLPKNS